jgi:hypothetical protein
MKTNSKEDLNNDAQPETNSRRRFLGKLGKTAAGAAAASVAAPFLSGKAGTVEAAGSSDVPGRMNDCFNYRKNAAIDMRVNVGAQSGNGDLARYTDYSGIYSKGLMHDALGIPNSASAASLLRAFQTGQHTDFNSIIVGTPGGGPNSKLNGPQMALAFDLQGMDSHATVIPAAPSVASAQTAAEQVEHYWGSLLCDVPFAEYDTDPLVGAAVADMNKMSFLASSANKEFPYPVTRQNLFRGQFLSGDGNVKGPYVSQFMVQPTYYGVQFLDQKYRTCLPDGSGGSNYMTTEAEYQFIQNGGDSGRTLVHDTVPRHVRSGRDLTCYTNVDVLFQGYFTAFLILANIGAAPNLGNPYIGSDTQKPFATLGGPDAAATLCEVATRALKASWYHKWIKDLKMRPEEYGALVHARMSGASRMPQAAMALHSDVLHSDAVARTFSKYGTYLLPQAFPEGSPTHPCYPTGHGTVGGACVTVLKFFFNGAQKLRPLFNAVQTDLVEPLSDGSTLSTYTGADRDSIDINGELNKLAWNVSVGHGIHSGIHFRSSTYWSILLGEQVALAFLQDRAKSYNEPFTISIKKFDGTTATISNQ